MFNCSTTTPSLRSGFKLSGGSKMMVFAVAWNAKRHSSGGRQKEGDYIGESVAFVSAGS
jgi:hypothetical protein